MDNPVKITITDTVTGKTAELLEPDFSEFQWTDGNYGCDCNRGIFFDRALDQEQEFESYECGSGRYKIRVTDDDGAEVYAE